MSVAGRVDRAGAGGGAVPWRLPSPLRAVVSRLPQFPPSAALSAALNAGLLPRVDAATLAGLEGKVVRIELRDAGTALTLRCRSRRFHPASSIAAADVTIGACLHDFARLALRREDPDTLFFARRLTIEGDTETGLIVKNMLDAADASSLVAAFEAAEALVSRLRAFWRA
ncbi:MAG: ubiquinone anaerobic biosynthesis accessory factor UbiT [Betaproteobacteria bacterium]